jgi:hypothetical protein
MPKEGKCTCATDVHVRYVRAPSYPDALFWYIHLKKRAKSQKKEKEKKEK